MAIMLQARSTHGSRVVVRAFDAGPVWAGDDIAHSAALLPEILAKIDDNSTKTATMMFSTSLTPAERAIRPQNGVTLLPNDGHVLQQALQASNDYFSQTNPISMFWLYRSLCH
jgi:hypothetical protein